MYVPRGIILSAFIKGKVCMHGFVRIFVRTYKCMHGFVCIFVRTYKCMYLGE